jgi:hypothetical protein
MHASGAHHTASSGAAERSKQGWPGCKGAPAFLAPCFESARQPQVQARPPTHDAPGVDVARRRQRAARQALWRHVVERAVGVGGAVGGGHDAGEPKVGDLEQGGTGEWVRRVLGGCWVRTGVCLSGRMYSRGRDAPVPGRQMCRGRLLSKPERCAPAGGLVGAALAQWYTQGQAAGCVLMRQHEGACLRKWHVAVFFAVHFSGAWPRSR